MAGMNDRDLIRLADVTIYLGPYAAIMLVGSAMLPWPLGLISAAVCGAIAVLFVVRELNQRDDSRFAKRPPDAP